MIFKVLPLDNAITINTKTLCDDTQEVQIKKMILKDE